MMTLHTLSIHPEHVDDVSTLWRQVFEEHCGGSLEFRMSGLSSTVFAS